MKTCVTHMNLEYDLAHHESPIAQWLERPTSNLGRSWVRLPLGELGKSFFREFNLRTLLHLLQIMC